MLRRTRSKKQRLGAIPELSMTPLIDVALTLLVIFIISSPVIQQSIKVNLPQGQVHETPGQSKSTVVYIDKESHLYLNGEAMNKSQILSQLSKQLSQNETIFVQADRAVDYGTVVELVDEMKVGGVKHVALATKKSSSTARA